MPRAFVAIMHGKGKCHLHFSIKWLNTNLYQQPVCGMLTVVVKVVVMFINMKQTATLLQQPWPCHKVRAFISTIYSQAFSVCASEEYNTMTKCSKLHISSCKVQLNYTLRRFITLKFHFNFLINVSFPPSFIMKTIMLDACLFISLYITCTKSWETS